MSKIKFSRKTKVFLSLGTGLLATTSVVTPLVCTSCSTNQDDPLKEFDRKFNIDDYKNKTFASKCESAYKTHLEHQGESADVIKTKVAALHDDLYSIIKKSKNATNSATIASNVMIDTMFEEYGIKMSREFDASINFDLEINNFRQSCVDSIVRMMQERKIPSSKVEEKVNDFNVKFRELRAQLSDRYNDGLSILTKIKADAAALLDGISDEMDQIAASSTFKKFSEKYQFVVKDELVKKNNTYWNNIHDKYHDGDNVSDLASKIFVLRDKNAIDPKKAELPINPVALANGGVIADYRVEPLWRGATGDMYNNKYSLSIEWRAISIKNYNRYKATGDKNIYLNTVATMSAAKDKTNAQSLSSVRDLLSLPSDKKSYSDYGLPITAEFEKTQLKTAYSQIHLGWDDGQGGIGSMANCAYEGYFRFENSTNALSLSDNQIGAIGLTVGSAYTNSVTRFDALKQQVQSKVNAGADFDSLSLEEKFVDSVDLVTFAQIENDSKHIVNNKFYAAYKNSPYADKSDTKHTYTYFEDWNSRFEGMPISKNLYDTTWKVFTKSYEEERDRNLEKAKDLRDECKNQLFADRIAQISSITAIGICIAIIALPLVPWKAWHILAASVGAVNVAFNASVLECAKDVYKKADTFYEQIKEWHNKQQYKDFMIDHVKNDYDKYLCSYDTFKSSPMLQIKPIIGYYNTLQLQPAYQHCMEERKKCKADFSQYKVISNLITNQFWYSFGVTNASAITFTVTLLAAHERILEYKVQTTRIYQETLLASIRRRNNELYWAITVPATESV